MIFAVLGLAHLAACGGAQRQTATEQADFACKDRHAGYVVDHPMGGAELGVSLDCVEGPRIKRWRVDTNGTRQEDARSLTPGEFNKLWADLDASGWPNLKDCTSGTGGSHAPTYKFAIKDDQNEAVFECQSQAMPFPYNTISDPLDVAAQNGRGQLGDDEPEDLKKLGHKDKHK